MKIYSLSSDRPICKQYTCGPNGLISEPYPWVYEVTSQEHEITSLQELHGVIKHVSAQGGCLIKGVLNKPLYKESRKGATDADTGTEWICLDLDGVEQTQSVDNFLDLIGLSDTSYVLQWSSSQNVENKSGFRCHIFMMLSKEAHPRILKNWLMHLNLSVGIITNQLKLTASNNGLKYPIDITTCQNDKLIYVAPPIFVGMDDPYGSNRIQIVTKANPFAVIPTNIPSKSTLRERVDEEVNRLRLMNGLKKRKATKYKFEQDTEYAANPDTAVVTGEKTERGFVYLNLNGGDSWGYFYPEGNIKFLYNFKGEDVYRIQDLLPEYYARKRETMSEYRPDDKGDLHFAFRDFETATYYNGVFNTNTGELRIAKAKSESQVRQYMLQNGKPITTPYIPDWNVVWNPDSSEIVDPVNKQLNIYSDSEYLKGAIKCGDAPPVIRKIIFHVLGGDKEAYLHFINWLAYIVQRKTLSRTAWVLQGTHGTGKGLLFNSIINPLLGDENVTAKRMEELRGQFTGFLKRKLVVFIDEIDAEIGESHYKEIGAKLKNVIAEPRISIREMYMPATVEENRANFIFASNELMAVLIDPMDRRFNVGAYQTKKLEITREEISQIHQELFQFAGFLLAYDVDEIKVATPLNNVARKDLILIGRGALNSALDALQEGNLEFFRGYIPDTQRAGMNNALKAVPYTNLVRRCEADGPTSKLTRDDIFTLLDFVVGNVSSEPHRFNAMLRRRGFKIKQIWIDGKNKQGVLVKWK